MLPNNDRMVEYFHHPHVQAIDRYVKLSCTLSNGGRSTTEATTA